MKNSDGSAQCRACHLKIEIKHRGRTALTDHIEKKKHLESLKSFQHVQPVISIFSLKKYNDDSTASRPTSENTVSVDLTTCTNTSPDSGTDLTIITKTSTSSNTNSNTDHIAPAPALDNTISSESLCKTNQASMLPSISNSC